jgi:hypothetical protein
VNIRIVDERKRLEKLAAEKRFLDNAEQDGINGVYAQHIMANHNITRAQLLNFVRTRRQSLATDLLSRDLEEIRRYDPKRNQPE